MSRNIEENVVKMRFDNSEFDQNVNESNNTISNFKDTLLALPQNIYMGLSNTLSGINLSNILGIGAALAGIGLVKTGITNLAYDIQSTIATTIGMINNAVNTVVYQIDKGGKARAMNIANAKFQIEGLKLDVETFMEAADYAVSGTAYSLDAAAKVASQLGASGVTQLEELKAALRSVSGVAAMTNSSYEEIGNIYTTMASNGKLMTENIRSFSARGLNVTANLAKSLGKTEAEISDMVTKGKIDFKTFYTAMDEAFGEHAKDANKTFTGALNNINSALSRIGEAFHTPMIENAVDIFNQIRLSINEFKKELQDNYVFEAFSNLVESSFGKVTKIFETFRNGFWKSSFMEEVSYLVKDVFATIQDITDVLFYSGGWGEFKQIGDNLGILVNKVKQIFWAVKEAFDEVIGISKVLSSFRSNAIWLTTLFQALDNLDDREVKDLFKNWFTAIKEIGTAIAEVLGFTYDSRKTISQMFSEAITKISDFLKNLKLSEEGIDKLKRTFRGIASAVDIIKMFLVELLKFILPIFGIVPKIEGGILSITATLGDFIYKIRNAIKDGNLFEKIFNKISSVIESIKDSIKGIGTNFFEAFFGDENKDKRLIDKIIDFFGRIKNSIKAMFGNNAADDFAKFGADVGVAFDTAEEILDRLNSLGTKAGFIEGEEGTENTVLSKIFDRLVETFNKIKDFFGSKIFVMFTSSGDSNIDKGPSFIERVGDKIKDLITSVADFINSLGLSDAQIVGISILLVQLLDVTKDIILGFFDFIVEMTRILTGNDTTDKFISIIDKLQGKSGKVSVFSGLKNFLENMRFAVGFISSMINGNEKEAVASKMVALGELVKSFAWLFASIAASLFVMSFIPKEQLQEGAAILLTFSVVIGILAAVLIILVRVLPQVNANMGLINVINSGNAKKSKSPLQSVVDMIYSFTIMFIGLAAALKILSKAGSPEEVTKYALVLGTIVGFVTAVISGFMIMLAMFKGISDESKGLTSIAIAFAAIGVFCVLIAESIKIISKAFKNTEDPSTVWKAFGMIAALILEVGMIFALIGAITASSGGGTDVLAAGIAFLLFMDGFTRIIVAFGTMLKLMSTIDEGKLKIAGIVIGALTFIVGAFGVMLVVLSEVLANAGPQVLLGVLGVFIILEAIFTNVIALAALVGATALVISSIAKVFETFQKLIAYLGEMDEEKADKVVANAGKILLGIMTAIPLAIGKYHATVLSNLKDLFPKITSFVAGDLLPFLDNLLGTVFPKLIKDTAEWAIKFMNALIEIVPEIFPILNDMAFSAGGKGIFGFVTETLDKLWDAITEWLLERIPVVVPDIFAIVLTFIRVINDTLSENWDDLDKELQILIDQTIGLLGDLLTGEKTWKDIDEMFGELFDHIKEVLEDNEDEIREAFEKLGEVMGSALLSGLVGALPEGKIKDYLTDSLDLNEVTSGIASDWSKSNSYGNDFSSFDTGGYDFNTSDFSKFTGDIDLSTLSVGNISSKSGIVNDRDNSGTDKNTNVKVNVVNEITGSLFNLFNTQNKYNGVQVSSGRKW